MHAVQGCILQRGFLCGGAPGGGRPEGKVADEVEGRADRERRLRPRPVPTRGRIIEQPAEDGQVPVRACSLITKAAAARARMTETCRHAPGLPSHVGGSAQALHLLLAVPKVLLEGVAVDCERVGQPSCTQKISIHIVKDLYRCARPLNCEGRPGHASAKPQAPMYLHTDTSHTH